MGFVKDDCFLKKQDIDQTVSDLDATVFLKVYQRTPMFRLFYDKNKLSF